MLFKNPRSISIELFADYEFLPEAKNILMQILASCNDATSILFLQKISNLSSEISLGELLKIFPSEAMTICSYLMDHITDRRVVTGNKIITVNHVIKAFASLNHLYIINDIYDRTESITDLNQKVSTRFKDPVNCFSIAQHLLAHLVLPCHRVVTDKDVIFEFADKVKIHNCLINIDRWTWSKYYLVHYGVVINDHNIDSKILDRLSRELSNHSDIKVLIRAIENKTITFAVRNH